jgi:hypothetical protein
MEFAGPHELKAKHFCGQTCLYKLVDDYMTRTLAAGAAVLGVGSPGL